MTFFFWNQNSCTCLQSPPMFRTILRIAAYYAALGYTIISCVYCLFSFLPSPFVSKILPHYGSERFQNSSEAWKQSQIFWKHSSSALYTNNGGHRHATSESLFLTKAFERSMGPSEVIPFYFRASGPDGRGVVPFKDITILTIVTSNRFSVLGKLAQTYGGMQSIIPTYI